MKNIIFALIFISVGVGVSIYGNHILKNAKASTDWPTVEGQVISSEVEMHRDTSGTGRHRRSSTTYHAEVLYEYTIKGVKYSSNRVSFGQHGSSNPTHARQIVSRYPPSKNVKVYFNPNKPEISVLEPGTTWASYMPLGIGIIFSFAGIAIFFSGFFRRY
jgi:hypothetical protein